MSQSAYLTCITVCSAIDFDSSACDGEYIYKNTWLLVDENNSLVWNLVTAAERRDFRYFNGQFAAFIVI